MNKQNKTAILNRLKSAAGHVNGIVTMVEQDRYCIDVIKQIRATQAALDKVSQLILDDHMHTCVTTAIQGDDQDERERVLLELSDLFAEANK
ncbi:MAG: metal-sensitive transcriptional regulator [Anaerolineae bacterium]|nr:metal-sensitive transcriptional regulator [Anaerolineae bacterium]